MGAAHFAAALVLSAYGTDIVVSGPGGTTTPPEKATVCVHADVLPAGDPLVTALTDPKGIAPVGIIPAELMAVRILVQHKTGFAAESIPKGTGYGPRISV